MAEALDRLIGDILVDLGLGSFGKDGAFTLGDLAAANTMLLGFDDNGCCWLGGASASPYPVHDYCDVMTTDLAASTSSCVGVNYCALPPSTADQYPAGVAPLAPPRVTQYATCQGLFKLVVLVLPDCLAPSECVVRLYRLAEPSAPTEPGVERADGTPGVWNPPVDFMPVDAATAYVSLKDELIALLLSERTSPSDGNLDSVIDGRDLAHLLDEWGTMGFWDANRDGVVDSLDLSMLFGTSGRSPSRRSSSHPASSPTRIRSCPTTSSMRAAPTRPAAASKRSRSAVACRAAPTRSATAPAEGARRGRGLDRLRHLDARALHRHQRAPREARRPVQPHRGPRPQPGRGRLAVPGASAVQPGERAARRRLSATRATTRHASSRSGSTACSGGRRPTLRASPSRRQTAS